MREGDINGTDIADSGICCINHTDKTDSSSRASRKKLVDIRGQIKCSKGSKVILHDKVGMRKGSYLYVRKGGIVEIGERTTFNHNCLITARKSITIGKRSIFGPGVMIYDHDHDYKTDMQEYRCEDVSIGGNCWIGANSIILKGVHLGDNCVVAAGTILRGGIILVTL